LLGHGALGFCLTAVLSVAVQTEISFRRDTPEVG
jgi:hypothetical protein